jgi:hypothetical protein
MQNNWYSVSNKLCHGLGSSAWPFTLKTQVKSQDSLRDICGEQRQGFSLSTLAFPCHVIPPMLHTRILCIYHQLCNLSG